MDSTVVMWVTFGFACLMTAVMAFSIHEGITRRQPLRVLFGYLLIAICWTTVGTFMLHDLTDSWDVVPALPFGLVVAAILTGAIYLVERNTRIHS